MKTYKTILTFIFIITLSFSCNNTDTTTTVDTKCPDNFPQWVKDKDNWNQTHQTSYEKGQIYFNEDSTLMFTLSGKPVEDSIWNKAKETIIVR